MSKALVPTNVEQQGNLVSGDLAGGDVNKPTFNLNLPPPAPPSESRLNRLYREFIAQAEGDPTLTSFIGQLEIFTRVVQDEDVIGLEDKLLAAARPDEIDMGLAMKEMIYGDLRQNMFSRAFQTIYATLMGKIYERFNTIIKPAINSGLDRATVDDLVARNIVEPLVIELESCPDCTDAPETIIRGMLYFLTGNCHLRWHQC